jgi:hypothetical protein
MTSGKTPGLLAALLLVLVPEHRESPVPTARRWWSHVHGAGVRPSIDAMRVVHVIATLVRLRIALRPSSIHVDRYPVSTKPKSGLCVTALSATLRLNFPGEGKQSRDRRQPKTRGRSPA